MVTNQYFSSILSTKDDIGRVIFTWFDVRIQPQSFEELQASLVKSLLIPIILILSHGQAGHSGAASAFTF